MWEVKGAWSQDDSWVSDWHNRTNGGTNHWERERQERACLAEKMMNFSIQPVYYEMAWDTQNAVSTKWENLNPNEFNKKKRGEEKPTEGWLHKLQGKKKIMDAGHQTELESEVEIISRWCTFSPHCSGKAILVPLNEKHFLKKILWPQKCPRIK